MAAKEHTVLWVDDERFALTNYKSLLERSGFKVLCAYSLAEGRALLESHGAEADLVILDVMMPLGETPVVPSTDAELAKGGYESGAVLARWVRERLPEVKIIAYTAFPTPDVPDWLESLGVTYVPKTTHFSSAAGFIRMIREAIRNEAGRRHPTGLRAFIVHGHDDATKWELKNYLQNVLHLEEPCILHERPDHGRTLIEKFEEEVADRNIIFVLLTPDDNVAVSSSDVPGVQARARQNVIFELGYFMGKLGRARGRVLLLFKQGVELPSDLAGVAYIDITPGIAAVGETIRLEIKDLL